MFYALSYALNRKWDVLFRVAEKAWDVLSRVAKRACIVQVGKNCMGCFVWGVKSLRHILSGVSNNGMGFMSQVVLSYIPLHNNYRG